MPLPRHGQQDPHRRGGGRDPVRPVRGTGDRPPRTGNRGDANPDSRFLDRRDAGRRLGRLVLKEAQRQGWEDLLVLGLPRGGVPVAAEVAAAVAAPLDVLVVRKLGVPGHPELAMGAIGADAEVLDAGLIRRLGIPEDQVDAVRRRESLELERRARSYRGGQPESRLAGRTVVLVDDGLATGATARAAVDVVRRGGAQRVVLAVPVMPASAVQQVAQHVDDLVYVQAPPDFHAVGLWYEDFDQTTDDEVMEALEGEGHAGDPTPAEVRR